MSPRYAARREVRWTELSVLVTGGTGSFGREFVRIMLNEVRPRALLIFSRDEAKQEQMQQDGLCDPSLRYVLGDVRDAASLRRVMEGVDVVVHAAALKQVPACENNPLETIRTNIDGAQFVIDAALDCEVSRVIGVSTDKAVNPVNLYGATKLVAEKLFIQANTHKAGATRFSCVRYGNVVGSRGSVIPLFLKQRREGTIKLTHPGMRRFWITLDEGVRFTIRCLERMYGGEIFVPKIPAMGIRDLIQVVAPDCELEYIGVRPGEKINEVLISAEESRHTLDVEDMYVVIPPHPWWNIDNWERGIPLPDGFRFATNENATALSVAQLERWVEQLEVESAHQHRPR